MLMLSLTESCRASIRAHGEGAFPEECCGAMLGRDREDGTREIVDVIAAPNSAAAERCRRYLLDPEVLLAAERIARRRGLDLLGIYHSHPDHPSAPSELDRQHAWPCWSYVILSVRDGRDAGLQSWRLRDDRSRFEEERIEPVG